MERRLAAILAADVAGYSRLMGEAGEEATLARLNRHRDRIDAIITDHGGRVFGSAGDSVIAEFSSPVEAVRCAVEFQLDTASASVRPEHDRMLWRIGIHLGDVIDDNGNLMGDGVNIAARLEALTPPGGLCVSRAVADQVGDRADIRFGTAGKHELKNIAEPVDIRVWPENAARTVKSTRPKRRFVLPVLAAAIVVAAGVLMLRPEGGPDLPTGPKIAIIPFKNVGANPDDAFFSEGLTRDVNALLAKFSNLFVIAPKAGEAFRDDPDCGKIRDELGADYILNGTVQRSEDRLRVTTTFTDAKTCLQLQAPGPFESDLSLESVLDVQLEIARKIAALIGSSDAPLFKTEMFDLIRDKAPETLDAYECYMTAHWFYQTFAQPEHRRARDCLLRTVKEEPGYSLAWSRLAYNYLDSKKNSYDLDPDWAQKSFEAAQSAIAADRDNADAYYALAVRSRLLGESLEVFHDYAKKAINLNPNDSWILADLGIFLAYSGQYEEGKEWITRARALNPKLHPGYSNAWILHAIMQGDYQEAINIMLTTGVRLSMSVATLAASYALNGDLQKAEETVEQLRERFPEFHEDPRAPFRARGMPQELIDRIMEGLTLAGYDVPPEEPTN